VVAFGAIAVDFGSFYTTANELQMAADAAALAGAERFQRSTASDKLAEARESAIFVGNKNRVLADNAKFAAGNVQLVHWDETTAQLVPITSTARGNAIQVWDTTQTSFVFGWVLNSKYGRLAPAVHRRAVAWTANVSGATCIRPIGFNTATLFAILGVPVPTDFRMTDAQVKEFNSFDATRRTFISNPPQNGTGQPSVPVPLPWQPYAGLSLDDRGGGRTEYQDALRGTCQPASNSVDVSRSYDLPSAMTSGFTTDVFAGSRTGNTTTPGLCRFLSDTDQTCYAPGTSNIGITFPVVFSHLVYVNGKQKQMVDMIADVTIRCYVRGTLGNGLGNSGEPLGAADAASCSSGTGNTAFNNVGAYSGGTIVAVVHANLDFFAGQLKYSDVPSISQRLILVR
jgi:hypothetical protein